MTLTNFHLHTPTPAQKASLLADKVFRPSPASRDNGTMAAAVFATFEFRGFLQTL